MCYPTPTQNRATIIVVLELHKLDTDEAINVMIKEIINTFLRPHVSDKKPQKYFVTTAAKKPIEFITACSRIVNVMSHLANGKAYAIFVDSNKNDIIASPKMMNILN